MRAGNFEWKELIPFAVSTYLVVAGSAPFTRTPFERYRSWIDEQLQVVQESKSSPELVEETKAGKDLAALQNYAKHEVSETLARLDTVSIVDRAKEAAGFSSLPAKVALTGTGYIIAFSGAVPVIVTIVLVIAALAMQDRADMTMQRSAFGLTSASIAVLVLNCAGLILSVLT